MVARGDLGLELPLERVPRVQKEITRRARQLGIPVIVATQVLESMREEPRPTRAEVSDAANAVSEGADAIMLAGETASGKYPSRAVRTLDTIIREAEEMGPEAVALLATKMSSPHGRALCEAAVTLAERGDASVIVAVTRGGHTAQMLSAFRPRAPIYAVAASPEVARQLALPWGVIPIVADVGGDVSDIASRVGSGLVEQGSLAPGSTMVVVSVSADLTRGASNFLKLQQV
jgi:pyruvate kinase